MRNIILMMLLSIAFLSMMIPASASAEPNPNLRWAVFGYITAYFIVQHFRGHECGKLIGVRPDSQQDIANTMELGKPYMTPSELEQYRTGQLQKRMEDLVVPLSAMLMKEALKISKGNTKEACFFSLGNEIGIEHEASVFIKRLGGPSLE